MGLPHSVLLGLWPFLPHLLQVLPYAGQLAMPCLVMHLLQLNA